MRLVVDASVDAPLIEWLRQEGHEVAAIREIAPRMADADILRMAMARDAILITADKDFGDLAFHLRSASRGILLLRLGGVSLVERLRIARETVVALGAAMNGKFTVVSPGQIRVRPIL